MVTQKRLAELEMVSKIKWSAVTHPASLCALQPCFPALQELLQQLSVNKQQNLVANSFDFDMAKE